MLSGETVLLTLFWQAMQKPAQDYTATLELVNDQNQTVLTQDFPLGAGRYPTTQWNANEQIIDLDRVRRAGRSGGRRVSLARVDRKAVSRSIWVNCA